MPCRVEEPEPEHDYIREIFELEVLLCSACSALEEKGFNFAVNPSLDTWWSYHKKQDEKRIAEEIKERLLREEAKQIAATKLFIDLNDSDKKLLRRFGMY